MASAKKGSVVKQLLELAHPADSANQIYTDKIQYRPVLLRPTSPQPPAVGADGYLGPLAGSTSLDGRDARRRSRRIKQELRMAHQPKPKPLSAHQRRAMGLYGIGKRRKEGDGGDDQPQQQRTPNQKPNQKSTQTSPQPPKRYDTFVPLHRLWLGYIREVLGPQELIMGGQTAAAKLTAADMHGAEVEVTRSSCVGRVGLRGIVVRDTRFVFEIVTPDNKVKMVPKEGTFFRVTIPVEEDKDSEPTKNDSSGIPAKGDNMSIDDSTNDSADKPTLVFDIIGSQFMHRATDRANRKFKQHFYKEL